MRNIRVLTALIAVAATGLGIILIGNAAPHESGYFLVAGVAFFITAYLSLKSKEKYPV